MLADRPARPSLGSRGDRNVVFVSRQLGHANPAITLKVHAHLSDAERHADEARARLEADYGSLFTRS